VQMIVTEKFGVLFVAYAIIDQNQAVTVFHEQTTHGPGTQIILVCRICFLPDDFGYNTKHGATIQLKKSRFDNMELHSHAVGGNA